MKRTRLARILLPVLLAPLLGAATPFARAQVAYVERSSGLEAPDMEEGNTEIEFADVDGDGHMDLVCVGDHGSPYINSTEHGVMVWFGSGTGSWSLVQYGNFGYGGVAIGDVNGDGFQDVGYGVHHDYAGGDLGDQILEVALGNGSGASWTPWDDGLATQGETWGMFGTDFADVDGDGDLDLGTVSFGCCAGVHVYRNEGDGTWVQSFGFLGGNSGLMFEFGEVNGDGFVDFAVSHQYGTVYLGDGNGGFARDDGNLPGAPVRNGISLGDVDGDGRDDLAFVTSGGGLAVASWVGPGVWQDLTGNLPTGAGFTRAQIADMDLDGRGDVLAFRAGSPGVVEIWSGDGQGQWQSIATVSLPVAQDDAAFRAGADADHNGYPDFVVVQKEYVGGFPIPWRNRPRFFAESSVPDEAWIHPVFPRGGETLVAGSVRFLEWTCAVPGGTPDPVRIELSTDGPSGPWTPVAVGAPNSGRFQWRLPAGLPSSGNAYLRFTAGGASAVTPQPFTLVGATPVPALTEWGAALGLLAMILAGSRLVRGARRRPGADYAERQARS
jgi:hypothetical protein